MKVLQDYGCRASSRTSECDRARRHLSDTDTFTVDEAWLKRPFWGPTRRCAQRRTTGARKRCDRSRTGRMPRAHIGTKRCWREARHPGLHARVENQSASGSTSTASGPDSPSSRDSDVSGHREVWGLSCRKCRGAHTRVNNSEHHPLPTDDIPSAARDRRARST